MSLPESIRSLSVVPPGSGNMHNQEHAQRAATSTPSELKKQRIPSRILPSHDGRASSTRSLTGSSSRRLSRTLYEAVPTAGPNRDENISDEDAAHSIITDTGLPSAEWRNSASLQGRVGSPMHSSTPVGCSAVNNMWTSGQRRPQKVMTKSIESVWFHKAKECSSFAGDDNLSSLKEPSEGPSGGYDPIVMNTLPQDDIENPSQDFVQVDTKMKSCTLKFEDRGAEMKYQVWAHRSRAKLGVLGIVVLTLVHFSSVMIMLGVGSSDRTVTNMETVVTPVLYCKGCGGYFYTEEARSEHVKKFHQKSEALDDKGYATLSVGTYSRHSHTSYKDGLSAMETRSESEEEAQDRFAADFWKVGAPLLACTWILSIAACCPLCWLGSRRTKLPQGDTRMQKKQKHAILFLDLALRVINVPIVATMCIKWYLYDHGNMHSDAAQLLVWTLLNTYLIRVSWMYTVILVNVVATAYLVHSVIADYATVAYIFLDVCVTGVCMVLGSFSYQIERSQRLSFAALCDGEKTVVDKLKTQIAVNAAVNEERKKVKLLLTNVLPAHVAKKLVSEPNSRHAATYSDVSVLFTDLVGFTSLSGFVAPDRLLAILDEIFSEFDEICDQFYLEKIKTIGDAYMLAGGISGMDDRDHVERAYLAGCAMIDVIRGLRNRNAGDVAYSRLDIRIGIHVGPVVAGVLGHNRLQYDLWGMTVNMAARLESSGEAGSINVSADVKARLPEDIHWSTVSVKLKGIGDTTSYLCRRTPHVQRETSVKPRRLSRTELISEITNLTQDIV